MASINDSNDNLSEIIDEDYASDRNNPSSDKQSTNKQEWIHDLLALSSLMSYHVNSDDFISSESRLIHSKFQRLFHFLTTDVYNEPIKQAFGDRISNLAEIDDALINLNRNATLKFRNYKQIREQVCFLFII